MPSIVTPTKRRRSPEPGWLTIGSLARATGIPPSTLRTWEQRYHVPTPTRKPSGHRLYPLAAVSHLRALRRALDLGRTPAEVMRLPVEELESLLGEAQWTGVRAESRGDGRAGARLDARALGDGPGASVAAALRATAEFDRPALRRALVDAWARFGPLDTLEQVVAPLLAQVGAAWNEGRLSVRHEHFASGVVSAFVREAKGPFEERAEGPIAATATLPGDLHEIGLLSVALALSVNGWRVGYLGADAPLREIAAFATEVGARAVAISVSPSRRRGAATAVRALRDLLPRTVELWLGGEGAPKDIEGTTKFESLAALSSRLER